MKTILWDEHESPFLDIPVLKEKSKSLDWFYIFDVDFNIYLLYHNVVI